MKKWVLSLFAVIVLASYLGACAKKTSSVSTSWADRYTSLLHSGKAADGAEFNQLREELMAIREELGDVYIYAISPIKDGKASIDGDETGEFMLTVDGSEVSEEWGIVYDAEAQFAEAWQGQVATARSAWNDESEQRWSVFAPIVNKDKQVVALLGIDSLVTDVMAEYSDWNRDSDNWNGYTDEVPGGYPVAIQEKLEQMSAQVRRYAEKLSASQK